MNPNNKTQSIDDVVTNVSTTTMPQNEGANYFAAPVYTFNINMNMNGGYAQQPNSPGMPGNDMMELYKSVIMSLLGQLYGQGAGNSGMKSNSTQEGNPFFLGTPAYEKQMSKGKQTKYN